MTRPALTANAHSIQWYLANISPNASTTTRNGTTNSNKAPYLPTKMTNRKHTDQLIKIMSLNTGGLTPLTETQLRQTIAEEQIHIVLLQETKRRITTATQIQTYKQSGHNILALTHHNGQHGLQKWINNQLSATTLTQYSKHNTNIEYITIRLPGIRRTSPQSQNQLPERYDNIGRRIQRRIHRHKQMYLRNINTSQIGTKGQILYTSLATSQQGRIPEHKSKQK
jgi:hypothetical protein